MGIVTIVKALYGMKISLVASWLLIITGNSSTINPSQHLPVCPTSTKLFGPHRKPLQFSARLAKGTRSTTKGPYSKLGSYTTSPRRQLQSEHKHQSGKEFSSKKGSGIRAYPDVVCRLAALFYRQPNGGSNPWKDFPISVSSMVQS